MPGRFNFKQYFGKYRLKFPYSNCKCNTTILKKPKTNIANSQPLKRMSFPLIFKIDRQIYCIMYTIYKNVNYTHTTFSCIYERRDLYVINHYLMFKLVENICVLKSLKHFEP